MELNKIYNMDCLEGMKLIDDESVDLVVTDPPYKIISGGCRIKNEGDECSGVLNRRKDWSLTDPSGCLSRGNKRNDWVDEVRSGKMFTNNDVKFEQWLPDIYRILKNKSHFYVMVNDKNVQEMLNECTKAGFKTVNVLAWKKNNVTPNKYYMKNLEFVLLFRKGNARNINNMGSKQCIEIPNIIGNKSHPTEKPVELLKILVENSSNENDVILDPFMGSGSTAIACINTNRQYIGFELDKNYYNIANKRIEEHTRQIDLFGKGGE